MHIIFRSLTYDFLYLVADRLIKICNPCQIHRDCVSYKFYSHNKRVTNAYGKARCIRDLPACCGGCKYLGPDGCTTKCLSCKLGLCRVAGDANPRLYKSLEKMRVITYNYKLQGIRMSKKEIFNSLKRYRLRKKWR